MCYVQPPMGTPFPHLSGTAGMSMDKPRARAGNWSKNWTLPGTSGEGEGYQPNRRLCHYNRKGNPKVLCEVGPARHGPLSWWLTRALVFIRHHDVTAHPELVEDYKAYRQDIREGGAAEGSLATGALVLAMCRLVGVRFTGRAPARERARPRAACAEFIGGETAPLGRVATVTGCRHTACPSSSLSCAPMSQRTSGVQRVQRSRSTVGWGQGPRCRTTGAWRRAPGPRSISPMSLQPPAVPQAVPT